ncbi:MAG: hypothetical protein FWC41_10620 [Firmicutes bacterium]|nr:hypothetical protein [Bacillota bacterium]
MASTVKSCFKYEKFDYVTYVPMYKDNSKSYNQSEILAKKVSKILQFPFEICLKKTKKNKVQRGLNFQERQLNVKGVYKSVKSLKNKKILLCDDVVTTGATLSECVKELSKSGAKVICVTAAYTEKNNSLNGNSS